jgi:hypothetical protein
MTAPYDHQKDRKPKLKLTAGQVVSVVMAATVIAFEAGGTGVHNIALALAVTYGASAVTVGTIYWVSRDPKRSAVPRWCIAVVVFIAAVLIFGAALPA